MTYSKFIKDLAAYRDKYGIVHGARGSISQNGALFTAHAIWLAGFFGMDTKAVRHEFGNAIKVLVNGGKTVRHPERLDEIDSTDNLVGLASAISMLKLPHMAEDILDGPTWWGFRIFFPQSGRKLKFPKEYMQAWLFRQRQVVAALNMAANRKPSCLDLAIFRHEHRKNAFDGTTQDSYLLGLHMNQVFIRSPHYGADFSWNLVQESRGRTFAGIVEAYLTDKAHPFIKYGEELEV